MAKTQTQTQSARSRTLKRIMTWPTTWSPPPQRRRDPAVDVPAPARSPTSATTSRSGSWRWAGNTNRRQLFNLSQAKSLHADGAGGQRRQPAHRGRQNGQPAADVLHAQARRERHERSPPSRTRDECDPIVEDMEVLLDSLREELHLAAGSQRRHGGQHRRWTTAATRSTAPAWAPAATASRRSSNPR